MAVIAKIFNHITDKQIEMGFISKEDAAAYCDHYDHLELNQIMDHKHADLINMSPEELSFNYTLKELKAIAADLKIQGRSKMDKIVLALNIEAQING